jgi:hypothetical protein
MALLAMIRLGFRDRRKLSSTLNWRIGRQPGRYHALAADPAQALQISSAIHSHMSQDESRCSPCIINC